MLRKIPVLIFLCFVIFSNAAVINVNTNKQIANIAQYGGIGYLMKNGSFISVQNAVNPNRSTVLGVVVATKTEYAIIPLFDSSKKTIWGPSIVNKQLAIGRTPDSPSNSDAGGLQQNINDNGAKNTCNILKAINYDVNSAAYSAISSSCKVSSNLVEGTYLPTLAEMELIHRKLASINNALKQAGGETLSGMYWTSDLHTIVYRAWSYNFDDGTYFAQLANSDNSLSARYGTPELKVRSLIALKSGTSSNLKGILALCKKSSSTVAVDQGNNSSHTQETVVPEQVSASKGNSNNGLYDNKINLNDVEDVTKVERNDFDYWADCHKKVVWQIVRFKNGTTRLYQDQQNYFVIKTQYKTNPYTGEVSKEAEDASQFINDLNHKTPILYAQRVLPNGYMFVIQDGLIKMLSPLGIIYVAQVNCDTQQPYFGWISKTNFYTDFKSYFVNSKTKRVLGPNGNALKDLRKIRINIPGANATGGYYDEKTGLMYYVLDNVFTGYWEGLTVKAIKLNSGVNTIPTVEELSGSNIFFMFCVPTDNITNVTDNDRITAINYSNGDYVKYSKIQDGQVYDCLVHRPNGVWQAKLDNNNRINSTFTYTKGPYKGLQYLGNISRSAFGMCLGVLDMVNLDQMEEDYNGQRELFNPANNKTLHLYRNGEIVEKVEAEKAAKEKKERAEFTQKANAIYKSYCTKYGKQNVDAILNNHTIKIGMPISVIKALCAYEKTDEGSGWQWYKVFFAGYDYDLENNKIKTYTVGVLPNMWDIKVVNGRVTYIAKRNYW